MYNFPFGEKRKATSKAGGNEKFPCLPHVANPKTLAVVSDERKANHRLVT